MKHFDNLKLLFTLCLGLSMSSGWAQVETFDYTGALDTYTVPLSVTSIGIEVRGAQGGNSGGEGAIIYGEFAVTPGDVFTLMVGQQGGISGTTRAGGGGGSFVADASSDPVICAGGGGGRAWNGAGAPTFPGIDASTTEDGNNGYSEENGLGGATLRHGIGGIDGNGATLTGVHGTPHAGNGGGFYTNGANGACGTGGFSFLGGGAGGFGCSGGVGGYGGGGNGGNSGGGGGGGYSGGGGSYHNPTNGGGGGSFNTGIVQDNSIGNTGNGQIIITVLCTALEIDIPVTGVCDGDELYLSATSATGGIVTWSGGVTDGLDFSPPPGTTTTYTTTSTSIDDCDFSIDIHSSAIPVITGTATPPSACEGAYIVLTGAGGLAMDGEDTPYAWTGTGDVTPEDGVGFPAEDGTITYTVIGTYLGCEGPAVDIVLETAAQPDVSGIADPEQLCLGDTYTLTGASDFATSYNWGGGTADGGTITPASAGTFIHFVVGTSDEGCTDTAFVTVVVNTNPIVDAGSDITVCEGDEVTLSGSGAVDYTWAPAITDGDAFTPDAGITTYTVTGTDANDCSDDDEVVVTVIELPYVASAIVVDEYYGYDGSIDITVAGGSGDYIYSWSHGPTTEDVTGLTSDVIYTVSIDDITIDPGMCTATESYTLVRFIGLDGESISQLTAYPNPTTDQLTVTYNGQFNYEVTTLLGEVVAVGNAVDQEQLSMKDLANGTYIVKVMAGDDISYVQVVKQ